MTRDTSQPSHATFEPNEQTDQAILAINELNLNYKPDLCKLTKNHESRPVTCDQKSLLKEDKAKPLRFGQGEDFDAALKKAQHFLNEYPSASEIADSELPESFDWRNVGGFDFTGEVRDQAVCGSCYIFSFI
jgi:C1A family cysteine protease